MVKDPNHTRIQETTMLSPTTVVAVVEPDHTVKAPPGLEVGAKVLLIPVPSLTELLQDTDRRARFNATRRAIQNAIAADTGTPALSDDAIVSLVRRARQAPYTD